MEGIYFIHTRELISSKEPIYKLGRSNNLECRVRNYPKGSNVLFTMNCKNSIKCEKHLIKLFKEKFIQKKDYGTEYFEGDKDEMINEIYNYLYICNTNEKANLTDTVIETVTETIAETIAETVTYNVADNIVDNYIKIANLISIDKNINKTVDKAIVKAIVKSIAKVENTKENIKQNVKSNKNIINKDKCRTCPNCKYEFKFPSLLKVHFRKSYHCLLSEDKIDDFFYKCALNDNQCNKCNKNFTNRQALLRHNRETKCAKIKNNITNLTNTITSELAKDIFTIIINKKKIN